MDERNLLAEAHEYANQYVQAWDQEWNMLHLKVRTVAEDSYMAGYKKAVKDMKE